MAKHEKRPTLLIVEDDEPLLKWLVKTLEGDFDVTGVGTFQDAARFVDRGVDVLLCDVRLPDGSGVEFIRRAAAARRKPRIVAMSGRAVPNEAFTLGRAGALAYLEKPFGIDELKAALRAACEETPPLEIFVAAYVGQRTLSEMQRDVRRMMVDQAMAKADGSTGRAARLLGLTRQRVQQLRASRERSREVRVDEESPPLRHRDAAVASPDDLPRSQRDDAAAARGR